MQRDNQGRFLNTDRVLAARRQLRDARNERLKICVGGIREVKDVFEASIREKRVEIVGDIFGDVVRGVVEGVERLESAFANSI